MKTDNKKLKTQELKKEIRSFSKKKKKNHQALQTSFLCSSVVLGWRKWAKIAHYHNLAKKLAIYHYFGNMQRSTTFLKLEFFEKYTLKNFENFYCTRVYGTQVP